MFTKLLFQYEHVRLLHTGAQSLLNSIRQTFWPIADRNIARSTVRKCIRCFRFEPRTPKIIMADLPKSRFTMNFFLFLYPAQITLGHFILRISMVEIQNYRSVTFAYLYVFRRAQYIWS